MGLSQRRRWRNRIVLLAALSAIAFGVSWLVPPVDAALTAFTRKLATATVRIDPVLVTEHFLLQAVACQQQSGLRCAPLTLPDGRGSVARRPSIDPASATSRRDARVEVSEGLASPSAWLRALAAAPGAALFTVRYISSQGWEAWLGLTLSLITAMTLLFWLVDSALACIVLTPVLAIGVSWLLGAILGALVSSGWEAPVVFLAAVVVAVTGRIRDMFEASAAFDRFTRWRRKRNLARASPDF